MKQELILRCPVCRKSKTKKMMRVQDFRFKLDYHSYLRKCGHCGLIFLSPRPVRGEIGRYYPPEYFDTKKKYFQRKYRPPIAYWPFYRVIKKISSGPGKVLDLGCGKGDLLVGLKNQGWQCFGTEISEESVKYARNNWGIKNIVASDIELAEFKPEYFDLIIMRHVLEHLYDPKGMLKKIKKWLKKDGRLILAVPNFDSLLIKILKEKAFLEIPRHLYQFTPTTLKRLIRVSGLEIERGTHFSLIDNIIVFKDTMAFLKNKRINPRISAIDFLSLPWACFSALLGKNDTIIIVAKKNR